MEMVSNPHSLRQALHSFVLGILMAVEDIHVSHENSPSTKHSDVLVVDRVRCSMHNEMINILKRCEIKHCERGVRVGPRCLQKTVI